MKKIICVCMAMCLFACFLLTACNRQVIDLTYNYNYAWIELPNGECVEGPIQSWKDFEDGDQIQVKIYGITYLTDTTRCVLASNYKG